MRDVAHIGLELGAGKIDVVVDRVDGDGESLPLARARNRAAELCDTQQMVFLDVDCIAAPTMLDHFCDAIESDDRLWMGSPRYLPPEMTRAEWQMKELDKLSVRHPIQPELGRGQRLHSTDYEKFWSLCFGLRRETFARVGGFNESFADYGGEDTDFSFAAREAGVPFGFVDAVAYHQHHAVCKPPLNHFDAIIRNAIQFHRRWKTWPMQSWLHAFAQKGFVDFDASENRLEILAEPTRQDVEEATVMTPAGF